MLRAASYVAHSDESKRAELNAAVNRYILQRRDSLCNFFALSKDLFEDVVQRLAKPGKCADEHVIYVLSDVLSRDVVMHIAFLELWTWQPSFNTATSLLIHLVFYGGLGSGADHYKAAVISENLN